MNRNAFRGRNIHFNANAFNSAIYVRINGPIVREFARRKCCYRHIKCIEIRLRITLYVMGDIQKRYLGIECANNVRNSFWQCGVIFRSPKIAFYI